ncbi:hypothetical protein K488DRAFT_85515 [Vararia minispora EC-137]|uniref:Uncharacterized protein n=1 Tax=Vararia minispora EC-137 TaxID=1314806 RepID=A0ACB8QMD3_9AGAM|nr:hypothetical protein K488DRAFT_85515 [Vararia minispora EC-137]
MTKEAIKRNLLELTTSGHPTVLLVYNKQATLELFDEYGINTSRWATSGLDELFYPGRNSAPPHGSLGSHRSYTSQHRVHGEGRLDHRQQRYYPRSRSRSPSRGEPGPSRERSPVRDQRTRVFVVDVMDMFATANMRVPETKHSLRLIREHSGESRGSGDEFYDGKKGVNAGNDSRAIAEMWFEMASGDPIIVQIVKREQDRRQVGQESEPEPKSPKATAATAETNEDADPSLQDMRRAPQERLAQPANSYDPYADFEDEDE